MSCILVRVARGSRERATAETVGVTDSVVAHLEELVLGELEPGAALPSESELAGQLGVSRLTVREATKSLQARGLLDIRQGRRPIVAHPSAGPIGDYFTAAVRRDPRRLMDLIEVRRGLEVHIASLAAATASRAAIAAAEATLVAMRAAADDPVAFHENDIRFHESLAEGSGNQLLCFLIEAMEEPLRSARMQSMQGHLARGGSVDDVIDAHVRILERVKERDAAGAAEAMRDHLSQTARDLRAFLALGGSPPDGSPPDGSPPDGDSGGDGEAPS
jgi:GntR family transcriptional regulator, transcriptional repressor for pyruvate dehydrogenase complex